jgi:hypothetical protein
MVFESQTKTISLILQGQRGTQISLMPNLGHVCIARQWNGHTVACGTGRAEPLWRRGDIMCYRGQERAKIAFGESCRHR